MTDALGPRPIPKVDLKAATIPDLTLLITDRTAFAERMKSPAPGGWPQFPEAIRFTIDRLATHLNESDWWMHYFLVNGLIVGSGGFVGRPQKGVVEIGYEIAPGFQGRRYGVGAASALVERAYQSSQVKSVIAHTLTVPGSSTRILERLGFVMEEEVPDAENGKIWRWRLARA